MICSVINCSLRHNWPLRPCRFWRCAAEETSGNWNLAWTLITHPYLWHRATSGHRKGHFFFWYAQRNKGSTKQQPCLQEEDPKLNAVELGLRQVQLPSKRSLKSSLKLWLLKEMIAHRRCSMNGTYSQENTYCKKEWYPESCSKKGFLQKGFLRAGPWRVERI